MNGVPLVLIVEDQIILAMDLEELFTQEGYRTELATSAAEVEDILLRCSPAAALVDLRLTDGMTGPDIARRLHEQGVPVLIHSGERTGLDGIPCVAFVAKPAPHAVLLAEIRRALGGKNN